MRSDFRLSEWIKPHQQDQGILCGKGVRVLISAGTRLEIKAQWRKWAHEKDNEESFGLVLPGKKKLVFLENIEPKIDGLAERNPHAEVSKYPF